jgi:hypothetical protein
MSWVVAGHPGRELAPADRSLADHAVDGARVHGHAFSDLLVGEQPFIVCVLLAGQAENRVDLLLRDLCASHPREQNTAPRK